MVADTRAAATARRCYSSGRHGIVSRAGRKARQITTFDLQVPESGPMPYKDMREFLDVLRKDGQLIDCDVPIKAAHGDNELQALM
jgi:hypothetical protein